MDKILKKLREKKHPGRGGASICAEEFGVSRQQWYDWESGKRKPGARNLLKLAAYFNVPIEVFSSKAEIEPLLPEPNALRRLGDSDTDHNVLYYPVAGLAAADETKGAKAGVFNEDVSAPFGDIELPETTHFVKILGDSMAPMFMDGQYAIVGSEYVLPHSHPQDREIVIASVTIKDEEQAGIDRRFEGIYCKRVVDADAVWLFESINHTGAPFTIAKSNCRLWPVIGVYFAGSGRPPEED